MSGIKSLKQRRITIKIKVREHKGCHEGGGGGNSPILLCCSWAFIGVTMVNQFVSMNIRKFLREQLINKYALLLCIFIFQFVISMHYANSDNYSIRNS